MTYHDSIEDLSEIITEVYEDKYQVCTCLIAIAERLERIAILLEKQIDKP